MMIAWQTINGVKVAELPERVDANSSKAVEEQLMAALDEGTKALVCDLAKTAYVSSAGLRVFLAVLKRVNKEQSRLALCGLQPVVAEVMEMTGFIPLFAILPDADAAVEKVAGY